MASAPILCDSPVTRQIYLGRDRRLKPRNVSSALSSPSSSIVSYTISPSISSKLQIHSPQASTSASTMTRKFPDSIVTSPPILPLQQQQQQQHASFYTGSHSSMYNKQPFLNGSGLPVAITAVSSSSSSPMMKTLQQQQQHIKNETQQSNKYHHHHPVKSDKPRHHASPNPIPVFHIAQQSLSSTGLKDFNTPSPMSTSASSSISHLSLQPSFLPRLISPEYSTLEFKSSSLASPSLGSFSSLSSTSSSLSGVISPVLSSSSSSTSEDRLSTNIPIRIGPEKQRKKVIENETIRPVIVALTSPQTQISLQSPNGTLSLSSPTSSSSSSSSSSTSNSNSNSQTPTMKRHSPGESLSPGEVLLSNSRSNTILSTDTYISLVPTMIELKSLQEPSLTHQSSDVQLLTQQDTLSSESIITESSQNITTKDAVLPTTLSSLVSTKTVEILNSDSNSHYHSNSISNGIKTNHQPSSDLTTTHQPLRPRKPASTAPLATQILSPATRRSHESVPTSIYWSDSFRPHATIVGDSESITLPSTLQSVPSSSTYTSSSSTFLDTNDHSTVIQPSIQVEEKKDIEKGVSAVSPTMNTQTITTPTHSLPSVKELLTVLQSQMYQSPSLLKFSERYNQSAIENGKEHQGKSEVEKIMISNNTNQIDFVNKGQTNLQTRRKEEEEDKEEETKKKIIIESSLSSLQLTTENFQKSKVKIPEELEGVSSTETMTPTTLSTVPIATFEPDSHVASDTQILTKTTTPILSSSSHVMPVHHIRRGAGLRLSSFVKTLDVNEEEEKGKTVLDVDNCGMEEDKTKVERSKGNVFEKTQVLVDVSSSSDPLLVQALSPVVSNHRGNSVGGGKEEEEDEFIVEFVDDSNVWGET
jgi:hypothetical protein